MSKWIGSAKMDPCPTLLHCDSMYILEQNFKISHSNKKGAVCKMVHFITEGGPKSKPSRPNYQSMSRINA